MSKKAKITRLVAFEIACPECGEPVENPDSGSLIWMPHDVRAQVPEGQSTALTNCQTCGAYVRFSVPKAAL